VKHVIWRRWSAQRAPRQGNWPPHLLAESRALIQNTQEGELSAW